MPVVAAAYPFIEVRIDTSALRPVAQRAPGVIAVVGKTPNGAGGGAVAANTPMVVATRDDAATFFSKVGDNGPAATTLFSSLELALLQDPRPSKIYGVRVSGDDYAAALASLEGVDDVTFVALARETAVGEAATGNAPASGLMALKAHVENVSGQGNKRLGVAMVDPATSRSPSYPATVLAAVDKLKSDYSRMVLVAGRGADGDLATAAMAAMAALPPHISLVLKRVRGVKIPPEQQFSPGEITALSEGYVNPVIDPALILGTSLHFADGRCFTSDDELLFVDTIRTLDDIDFRLKAGLIGSVGDARITRAGLTQLRIKTEGILGVLKRAAVIEDFEVRIEVLDILDMPESAWTPAERELVETARANRSLGMLVTVTYGPAVHRLLVTLAPKF
jgi:hypothetical protein